MNKIFIKKNIIKGEYQHFLYHRFTRDVEWKMNQNHPFSEYEPGSIQQRSILSDKFNSFPIYTANHMSHNIIDVRERLMYGDNMSFFFSDVIPIVHYFQKFSDFKFNYRLSNIEASLKHKKDIELKESVNQPHIDLSHPDGYTFVYFVCDSDGDLILYNEKYKEIPYEKLTINKRIKPRMGTLVCFPSNIIHSHNFPTKNPFKITIDFNIIYSDF